MFGLSSDMRFLRWFLARLESPRAARWVVAGALVLSLPTLFTPLVADDYIQWVKQSEELVFVAESGDGLGDFFVFSSGDPAAHAVLMEDGFFPWWAPPDFKLAFARPLSAATHFLDFYAWPGHSGLIHAHSLLWFALLLWALSALYRRFHAPPLAALALALYAFDDARGMVLSFAANRNALIAALFGVLALIAHDRWRRDGWRLGAFVGPGMLAIGLLAGESAVAITGFLFAHAVCLDTGRLAARLGRLAPYAAVVLIWHIAYSALGYGAEASGVYVHPTSDPLIFLAKVMERGPLLALAQLGGLPADAWLVLPSAAKMAVYTLAWATIGGVGYLVWPLLRTRPLARFWAIGGALSIIPVCATFASDRLLVFVGIGAAGLLACLFARVAETPPSRRLLRAMVIALVGVHLVVAPLCLPARTLTTYAMASGLDVLDETIPRDPESAKRTMVVVATWVEAGFCFLRWTRVALGVPQPHRQRLLSTTFGDVTVTRLDAQTLALRPENGFVPTEAQQMIWGEQRPMEVGHTVTLSDMTVTVTETSPAGRPLAAEFRFSAPLESPQWNWVRGDGMGVIPWTPPAVGATTVIPVRIY